MNKILLQRTQDTRPRLCVGSFSHRKPNGEGAGASGHGLSVGTDRCWHLSAEAASRHRTARAGPAPENGSDGHGNSDFLQFPHITKHSSPSDVSRIVKEHKNHSQLSDHTAWAAGRAWPGAVACRLLSLPLPRWVWVSCLDVPNPACLICKMRRRIIVSWVRTMRHLNIDGTR